MPEINHPMRAGWIVGQSIALELDAALFMVLQKSISAPQIPDLVNLVEAVPAEWRAELLSLLETADSHLHSVLEPAADLVDVLFEEDYSKATLSVRQMDAAQALARLAARASEWNVFADESLSLEERLVDLFIRFRLSVFQAYGFSLDLTSPMIQTRRHEMNFAVRILQGGDLHDRFWHWMDRFYYEVYRPWRGAHQALLDEQEHRAVMILGAKEKSGSVPEIGWLPDKNPLLRYPELRSSVETGRLKTFFWVEPFGLADNWLLRPDQVVVSFSEPGEMFENFLSFARDVTTRAQALADPTRLIILRLIRHISMTNTDMADYLGLARPTVSVHARLLREAGLIRSWQEGRIMRHEIVPQEVHRLFRDMQRFLDLPEEESDQG